MVGNHFGVDGSQFDLLLRGCEKGCEEDFSFEIELSLKSFLMESLLGVELVFGKNHMCYPESGKELFVWRNFAVVFDACELTGNL